jgi:hypothetical protein
MATENKQLEIIKKYLDEMAAKDPVFAAKYKDPKHNLEDCMKSIKEQARKQAVNGCAMIEDVVVYGWAVHYYDEPVKEKSAPAPKQAPAPAKDATPAKQPATEQKDLFNVSTTIESKKAPQTAEKEPEKKQYLQLSLF